MFESAGGPEGGPLCGVVGDVCVCMYVYAYVRVYVVNALSARATEEVPINNTLRGSLLHVLMHVRHSENVWMHGVYYHIHMSGHMYAHVRPY